jgi:hypothetical protein
MWGTLVPDVHEHDGIRMAMLEAFASHELTHCRDFLAAYDHFELSSIVLPKLRATVHDLAGLGKVDTQVDQARWRETLADLGALLYTKAVHPEIYDNVRRAFLALRAKEGQSLSHDTWALLVKADVSQQGEESTFAAAVRIRNDLYHVAQDLPSAPAIVANQ